VGRCLTLPIKKSRRKDESKRGVKKKVGRNESHYTNHRASEQGRPLAFTFLLSYHYHKEEGEGEKGGRGKGKGKINRYGVT